MRVWRFRTNSSEPSASNGSGALEAEEVAALQLRFIGAEHLRRAENAQEVDEIRKHSIVKNWPGGKKRQAKTREH